MRGNQSHGPLFFRSTAHQTEYILYDPSTMLRAGAGQMKTMQIREYELIDLTKKAPPRPDNEELRQIREAVSEAVFALLALQRNDGYWWFSLQANETIGSEFVFLMHFLGDVDDNILQGIANRILQVQREDGSWALYQDGPADLSTSIECYFALKLAGRDTGSEPMVKAREYILSHGGIVKARVFTRIHLAMFGLVPWSSCPEMPAEAIFLPNWFPINIYEFASWARATIVPLLIFMSVKPVVRLKAGFNLDELFCEAENERDYSFKTKKGLISWESFFIHFDKVLKLLEKIPLKPFRNSAIRKCACWTWDHVNRTEDIYPALAYAALAFKALGYPASSPQIKKPFDTLKSWQQCYVTNDVPSQPEERRIKLRSDSCTIIHQQCCISPVWDTPWAAIALLEAGVPNDAPPLLKTGRWLISKQIRDLKGDWAVKNPKGVPGGWSFEFKNDYFPDVDDTIEVVHVLSRLALPASEKEEPIGRGISWLLSMQNDDGGWGAFDKNQKCTLVNRIPFSDHGACLDPSSPDITGRMLELLAGRGMTADDRPVKRALDYILRTQESFGGWFARWGINYIYGTWCVLTGLAELGWSPAGAHIKRAVRWLKSIQNEDGGFGESPQSYPMGTYVRWKESVPSQTAWGLMALVAAGEARSKEAERAAKFLVERINANGSWDETAYTGTGFPGHFYIRYHGYRQFFPLLALARYNRAVSGL